MYCNNSGLKLNWGFGFVFQVYNVSTWIVQLATESLYQSFYDAEKLHFAGSMHKVYT